MAIEEIDGTRIADALERIASVMEHGVHDSLAEIKDTLVEIEATLQSLGRAVYTTKDGRQFVQVEFLSEIEKRGKG
jgi:hypothetical protein